MKTLPELKQPLQPVGLDAAGRARFKDNKIVVFLLDAGPFDMNQLAAMSFPREDREQFAQLIGYSLAGFSELSYVSDETYATAQAMTEGDDPRDERIRVLEDKLENVRRIMRTLVPELFQIHASDLTA